MSMRLDHLRARLLDDLDEMADYLDDHPHDDYARLGREVRELRAKLRTHGHHIIAEPLPVTDEEA